MYFGVGINSVCVRDVWEFVAYKGVEENDSNLWPWESSGWWYHLLTRGGLGKDWSSGCGIK